MTIWYDDRLNACSFLLKLATILPRAVLLALRQMKASTGRIPDYALWNECLTTLSDTVEKSLFFARRVTRGSSRIRFIVIRCGPVVDRRPR